MIRPHMAHFFKFHTPIAKIAIGTIFNKYLVPKIVSRDPD